MQEIMRNFAKKENQQQQQLYGSIGPPLACSRRQRLSGKSPSLLISGFAENVTKVSHELALHYEKNF